MNRALDLWYTAGASISTDTVWWLSNTELYHISGSEKTTLLCARYMHGPLYGNGLTILVLPGLFYWDGTREINLPLDR